MIALKKIDEKELDAVLADQKIQPEYLIKYTHSGSNDEIYFASDSETDAWIKAKNLALEKLWNLCGESQTENGISFDYASKRITLHNMAKDTYRYYDIVKRQKGEYFFDDYREF